MSPRMPTTRISLLAKLADQDSDSAWYEFVETYQPALYRVARRRGLQPSVADDVVQEVFIAAAKKIPQWDQQRGSLRAWLLVVTRNILANTLSRRLQDRAVGGDQVELDHMPGKTAGVAATDWEFRRAAFRKATRQVQDEFSETAWECFQRTGVQQQSATDVASELGLSVGVVYTNKCRVLKRFRSLLSDIERTSS